MDILFLAITGIILSIFFSSSEIALISASKLQINVWEKQGKRLSHIANSIIKNKEFYLFCILVGNNLANMLTTSFLTIYLVNNYSVMPQYMVVIIISLLILMFAEIIPKSIIRQFSNIALLLFSPILFIFGIILYPIYFLFNLFIKPSSNSSIFKEHDYMRDDIQHVYKHVDESIEIEEDQKEMLSNVFTLGKNTAYEVMTPRTKLSMISDNDSLEEALHAFIDSGHSKLPVYNDNIDNIIGVVYLYDLFKNPNNINEIVKPVNKIPFTKHISDIMTSFQKSNSNLAIVIDEHGGTAGLITAEDIFEELFGEFEDEFDHDEVRSKLKDDGSIITNARIECDEFNKLYNNLIPEGNYETLAGYIISEVGRIPNQGENLFLPIGQILIKKSSSRKIEEIQIFPNKSN